MAGQRETIHPDQISEVLHYYDLGPIRSARTYPRGSRSSPKVLLETESGRYLLKRRAPNRANPQRIAFCHAMILHLRQRGFPTPAIMLRKDNQDPLLRLHGYVYEVFEYVEGERFDDSLEATTAAGITLARFHRQLRGFETSWPARSGGFHDADVVRNGLQHVPSSVASHDSVVGKEAELLSLVQQLLDAYDQAAGEVNRRGYADWPRSYIHGDWHPGNLLYRDRRVVAVLDFDAARRGPLSVDLANGMLQFSILRGGDEPMDWPEFFDSTRMRRFFRGYRSRVRLPRRELSSLPSLMIESLIAEATVPIAATGSFGVIPGFGVLRTVQRKVRWLRENQAAIEAWLTEGT